MDEVDISPWSGRELAAVLGPPFEKAADGHQASCPASAQDARMKKGAQRVRRAFAFMEKQA